MIVESWKSNVWIFAIFAVHLPEYLSLVRQLLNFARDDPLNFDSDLPIVFCHARILDLRVADAEKHLSKVALPDFVGQDIGFTADPHILLEGEVLTTFDFGILHNSEY